MPPPTSWKQESIDGIVSKLSFVLNTFVMPYVDEQFRGVLDRVGMRQNGLHQKGIIRFKYDHADNAPVTRAGMDTFFDVSRPVSAKRVMPTVQEEETTTAKYAYEYVGFINIPERDEYTFGVNSDDAVDVLVNRVPAASWYGSHTMNVTQNVPGGNQVKMTLEPGHYPIRVRFVKATGNKVSLLWKTTKVNDYSVIGCENLFHDPAIMTRDVSINDGEFDETDFLQNLADYDRFIQYFGVLTPEMRSKIETSLSKIQVSSAGGAFTAYNSDAQIPVFGDNGTINGDINFNALLTELKSTPNGNRLETLIELLNVVRVFYYLFDDEVFENIKAGNPVNVASYELSADGKTSMVPARSLMSDDMLAFLSKFTRIEFFIFRRMMLLMDLVIHSHISMRLFQLVYSPLDKTADEPKLSDMVVFFVSRLKRLNSNFGQMFEEGRDSSVVSSLYTNIRDFNKNTERITVLDEQVKESKIDLKASKDLLRKESSTYSNAKKWAMYSFILTIVVVTGLIGYAIMAKVNPAFKWVGASGVSIVAALIVLTIYLVKSKQLEGFDGTTGIYSATNLGDLLASKQALEIISDAYQIDIMKEMNLYIQNTINLALILQNNNAFKYINHNLSKEINYYASTKSQMDNATSSTKASERMYNLQTRLSLSKINVFIAIVIILTATIVGYTVANEMPTIQYIILTVASVLLLLVAILYILDTQSKVRTDGSKMYWGTPSDLVQRLK